MPRISINLGRRLIAELDAAAEEDEVSRSEMIRALLRMSLDICADALDEEPAETDDEEEVSKDDEEPEGEPEEEPKEE